MKIRKGIKALFGLSDMRKAVCLVFGGFLLPILLVIIMCIFMVQVNSKASGAMAAYNEFLSSEEIEWEEGEIVWGSNLLFSVCDLDGDGQDELVVQNDEYQYSISPRQKIFIFNEEDEILELVWESTDAYEMIVGYDNIFFEGFVSERDVRGTHTTSYYDMNGKMKGCKIIVEDTNANEFLDEQVDVKVYFEWDNREVDAETFEKELFNFMNLNEVCKIFWVRNESVEREKYIK